MQPEQEFYLQPVEPGKSRNAASICAVDFSFGGDHLWDRFSVSHQQEDFLVQLQGLDAVLFLHLSDESH